MHTAMRGAAHCHPSCSAACSPASRAAAFLPAARCRSAAPLPLHHACSPLGTSLRVRAAPASPSSKQPDATLSEKPKLTAQPPQEDPWQKIIEAQAAGTPLQGNIKSVNKGGVVVQLGALRGFIPFSKLNPARLKSGHQGDLDYLVNATVNAMVVSVDLASPKKELVLSEIQALSQPLLAKLKIGDVVNATAMRLTDYGVFVELDDVPGKKGSKGFKLQGMVHRSELSWDAFLTVDQVAAVGQKMALKVMEVDPSKCRLILSAKALQQDPLKQTIESLAWHEAAAGAPVPQEVLEIAEALRSTEGISDVSLGLQAEEAHTVSQDLEVYLTRKEVAGGYVVVARFGRAFRELRVSTALDRPAMKTALRNVLQSLRATVLQRNK